MIQILFFLTFGVILFIIISKRKGKSTTVSSPTKKNKYVSGFSSTTFILAILLNIFLIWILFTPKPSSHRGGQGNPGKWAYFEFIFFFSLPAAILSIVSLYVKNNTAKVVLALLSWISIGLIIFILISIRSSIAELFF